MGLERTSTNRICCKGAPGTAQRPERAACPCSVCDVRTCRSACAPPTRVGMTKKCRDVGARRRRDGPTALSYLFESKKCRDVGARRRRDGPTALSYLVRIDKDDNPLCRAANETDGGPQKYQTRINVLVRVWSALSEGMDLPTHLCGKVPNCAELCRTVPNCAEPGRFLGATTSLSEPGRFLATTSRRFLATTSLSEPGRFLFCSGRLQVLRYVLAGIRQASPR